MLSVLIAAALAAIAVVPPSADEVRVVEYLKAHVRPGEPVVVSELYGKVFTAPAERAALERLFNTFFKVPLYVAQRQRATGRPPTLAEISEQFRYLVPGEAELVLRIMESDPRVPRFFERDPRSGEITRVDIEAIARDPRFSKAVERTLGGLEGRAAPEFAAKAAEGHTVSSESLRGRPHLLYFWFSGCPPCVRTAPLLADLDRRFGARGLVTVALNADRALEVPTSEQQREGYARSHGWGFTRAEATQAVLDAHGGVTTFPTFVFVDRGGVVVKELFSYQEAAALEQAARRALE